MRRSNNRERPFLRDSWNGDNITNELPKRVSYDPFRIRVMNIGVSNMEEVRFRMSPWAHDIPPCDVGELFEDCRLAQFAYVDGKPTGVFGWSDANLNFRERDQWLGNLPVAKHPEVRQLIVRLKFFIYRKVSGRAYGGAASILAAALGSMPEHWREQTGIMPLLAEASMLEAYKGTCSQSFKATGWFQPRRTRYRSKNLPDQMLAELIPSAKQTIRAVFKNNMPVKGEFTCES